MTACIHETFALSDTVSQGAGLLAHLAAGLPAGPLLLVTSAGFTARGVTAQVVAQLGAERVGIIDQVTANPELDAVDALARQWRHRPWAGIVALGGGSVLDTAKALGVILQSPLERPLDRVLRHGQPLDWPRRLPVLAVPTTAGTGAEVTPFATLWDRAALKKYSLNDAHLCSHRVLLDPQLTLTLPVTTTLYTGLDAVSHALESLWNRHCTPASAALAVQALQSALHALPVVVQRPYDLALRTQMQQAALWAGLAISHTRTAIAHAMSYPLTNRYGIPHGLACSFTLLPIIRWLQRNAPALLRPYESVIVPVGQMLAAFDLPAHIHPFADSATIRSLAGEMLHQGRSDNFPLAVDERVIEAILQDV